jgi:antitoxin PrlF
MSLIIERSKITGKGQVQIPAKIREAAGVKIGDEVAFSLDEKGKIAVEFIRKKHLC